MKLHACDKELLVLIASHAGLRGNVRTSTTKISPLLNYSQQTVSRKLRALKEEGLIELVSEPSGCIVSLTSKGVECLREDFSLLKALFEARKKQVVAGRVKTGLGEGKYYVSRPHYVSQFKSSLGFKPFFGTLNLAVDPEKLDSFIFGLPAVRISGFKTDERTFGRIHAYRISIEGRHPGALIFPERTTHPKNEIEIISPVNLRKKLGLKEGSKVTFTSP